ncbi:hypothetical protein [Nitrospira moscoviensis]|uniref:hypothetical protein n=1 Tax=Nitrospira moscoviensis TaxID=42253 RepID=UPI0006A7E267|nr:hypothetical protein [Nitrospira moscoviensis]
MKHDRAAHARDSASSHVARERDEGEAESFTEARELHLGLSQSLDEFILDRFSTKLEDPRTGRKIDRQESWERET